MDSTNANGATEFGFAADSIVQEWLWDEDVDESLREQIVNLTGTDLVDEDYDGAADGIILWWRDGDDEDTLADTIVDAEASRADGAPFWVLTPKLGRPGAASAYTIQNAAKNSGMKTTAPVQVSDNWNAIRLISSGRVRAGR